MTALNFAAPYLIFTGNTQSPLDAKTGKGLVYWRPELCVGQLRYRDRGGGGQVDLGLPDLTPAEAQALGAQSLVVGVASFGGRLEAGWIDTFTDAMHAGLDIVSGMHTRLASNETLKRVAADTGQRLIDVREPPPDMPVASGRRRTGMRVLTVGTDCCVGKKYTALAMHREMLARKIPATFRATGQTGILIAGGGIPLDAVVSDFLTGAAELVSPDNESDHWDVIEGQGSLLHPAYAPVTLGLVHGSQADALVLCHDASRSHIDGYPGYPIPPLTYCIDRNLEVCLLTNANVRMVGVSLNTAGCAASERERIIAETEDQTGLPVVDPIATGVERLVDALLLRSTEERDVQVPADDASRFRSMQ